MSVTKIWTSEGQWSAPILGLDKIHFIKSIYRTASTWDDDDDSTDYVEHVSAKYEDKIELNNKIINYERKSTDMIDEDTGEHISFTRETFGVQPKEAALFKAPAILIQKLASKDPLLSAVYDEMIKTASVPSSVPDDYCLLFKFEEE